MFLRNQRGQMAIFIALFFQVLFVFFAMAINVGLVVHDKINLQNAVDLAAYYGAAKQGEILNQIAHINYQMRQNYKLFVWRYRVVGSLGLDNHPYNVRNPSSTPLDEVDVTAPGYPNPVSPVVCVSHFYWDEYNQLDPGANLCRVPTQTIPNIEPATGGGGMIPGYQDLIDYTQSANDSLRRLCLESGILNWMFAARMLAHYRVDGLVRKKMISKLASQLVNSKDLRDESIEEGVRNTFESNLTNSNLAGLQDMQYFNSMASGSCSQLNTWLPEIKINPVLMFTDYDIQGSNNDCTSAVDAGSSDVSGVPNRPLASGRLPHSSGLNNLPMGLTRDATLQSTYNNPSINQLIQHWGGEPNSDLHSSVGFEKNPWCMVYTGVKARTAVQKPFSPTGGTVMLEAHGFAKPFGGRIGPWYGKTWPQGSISSQATNRDQMVDPLLPSREISGGGASSLDSNDDLANYSRFPGDALGLKSGRAVSAMVQTFKNSIVPQNSGGVSYGLAPLSWQSYDHLGGQPSLEQTGDSLARDSTKPGLLRNFELAAVAPDWFDALYYSVEPSYYTNYFSDQTTSGGASLPANERIYDFGSVKDGAQGFNSQNNVMDQVTNAQSIYHPQANYVLRDWKKLLTSWHQKSANDYTMDPARFGECGTPVGNPSYPTTGNCLYGGRTGYSVKNVSRDYLLSGDHPLGGSQGATGTIQNPPTF